MKQVQEVLDAFVERYRHILKNNLIGVYLHGSLAMGCFNPESSDIDVLVIIEKDISLTEKRELAGSVLKLSNEAIGNDFEISVMLEEDARHFKYPTPFILHYSSMYKERYIKDSEFICGNGVDPDLAAHITILTDRGVCLFGKPINEVFEPVQKKYYIESIIADVKSARKGIADSPVYYILNLCRILYYLREEVICSKREGGEWGLSNLPVQYKDVVQSALLTYEDIKNSFGIEPSRLNEFADYMLEEINTEYKAVLKKL